MTTESAFFISPEGEQLFLKEIAVIQLLNSLWLFVHDADLEDDEPTIGLSLSVNDVFGWGGVDCEPVPLESLPDLYRAWRNDTEYGPIRWCCIRRGEQPQKPVADRMKKAGAWDAAMESLRPNFYDNAPPRKGEGE